MPVIDDILEKVKTKQGIQQITHEIKKLELELSDKNTASAREQEIQKQLKKLKSRRLKAELAGK